MAIQLRVISEQQRALGEDRSRVFGATGGSVGRAPDNDWVLPDPGRVISGHHFVLQYHGGRYWLTDISTNGVFVNGSDEPVSAAGRCELRDGDRLRLGEYEMLVTIDNRIEFAPPVVAANASVTADGSDDDIGVMLDVDSILTPLDASASGSVPRPSQETTHDHRVDTVMRASLLEALELAVATAASPTEEPVAPPAATPVEAPREEPTGVIARRQALAEARERAAPLHQKAGTWTDLTSAVQAFCRGAGIDVATLSPEAQAMLPLVAGQVLRETVVGLNDIALARMSGPARTSLGSTPPPAGGSSNPLRTSSSIEQSIQRLLESHNRLSAGPVESMRDVLQETKEHEAALAAAMRAGLAAVLDQLSPANVADQFEQGRARLLAPGQDPRPRYWEHYAEFYQLVRQHTGQDELPHSFVEAFDREYGRMRNELRTRRT